MRSTDRNGFPKAAERKFPIKVHVSGAAGAGSAGA